MLQYPVQEVASSFHRKAVCSGPKQLGAACRAAATVHRHCQAGIGHRGSITVRVTILYAQMRSGGSHAAHPQGVAVEEDAMKCTQILC